MSFSLTKFQCILFTFTGVWCTIDHLELVMPRYAIRGGDVILKCEHSVPSEQLHKVEWRKGGNKIFQYIKGRKPPFRYFPTLGAELNVSIVLGVVKYVSSSNNTVDQWIFFKQFVFYYKFHNFLN